MFLTGSGFLEQAGLSMALGAFLAGLLLAETEFALQVESDIAPYRGLLLGLFFMTVDVLLLNDSRDSFTFVICVFLCDDDFFDLPLFVYIT